GGMGGGLIGVEVAAKRQQAAERRLPHDLLCDRDAAAADVRVVDAECGLLIATGGAFKYLAGGNRTAADRRVGQRIERVEKQAARVGGGPGRPARGTSELITMIEHVSRSHGGSVPATANALRVPADD